MCLSSPGRTGAPILSCPPAKQKCLRLGRASKEAPCLPDGGGGRVLLVSGCQHTLPAHVQPVIHHPCQVLLSRGALSLFMTQPGLIPGIVLNK